jgi:hypothetical protein
MKEKKEKMSNYKKTLVTTLVILILSAMIVPLIKAETLTTDKLTYYLGEDNQAILTGTDFEPGISVTIQVTIAEDLNYNFTSEVIMVGDDGTFTYTYPLPGLEGNYTAAALDEAGTVLATTTFLDPTGYSPSAVTSSDSGGNTKTLFLPSDDVYAKITSTNTGSTTDYNFYIVTAIPANGQSLNDARGSPTSITVGSTSQTSLVWSHPTSTGTYYIIIDKGNAGSKDGIDVVSASFTVANLYVFGTDD